MEDIFYKNEDVRYTYKGRINLAYSWIPDYCENLLDAGCASGYGSKVFSGKAKTVVGIDNNVDSIKKTSELYPGLSFIISDLTKAPFKYGSFDVIIANDVIEHVYDDKSVFDEFYRLLKVNGILIFSLPHKGLFSFLDQDNLLRFVFKCYSFTLNLLRLFKKGAGDKVFYKTVINIHKHYSLSDVGKVLKNSSFKDKYKIEKVFRSGLFIGVIIFNIHSLLKILLGRRAAYFIIRPFFILAELDYFIPFGKLSYNIIVMVRKQK